MGYDLFSIGQLLQSERINQGYTIEDISAKLNLRKTLVRAVESGDRSLLPHEFYIKGYVREYAKLLGVLNEVEELLIDNKEPEQTIVAQQKTNVGRYRPRVRKSFIAFGIILLTAGIFLLFEMSDKRSHVLETKKTHHVSTATDVKSASQNVHEIPQIKKLMITCHERTWVSVVIDGNEKKEFMLSAEEVVLLNCKESFDLLVGNAGGVKIFFNGKDTGFTGDTKEVKRLTLS